MRKLIFLLLLLAVVYSLTACVLLDSNQSVDNRNIASTYLGNVEIAGLQLGININDIDLTVFTITGRDIPKFDFLFEELGLILDSNENLATIQGWISEGIIFSISGKTFITVEEITNELGEHYNSYWYDREQSMRAVTYADIENNISLTLIYFDFDDTLVWVVVTSI